jgi:hypothetical protein
MHSFHRSRGRILFEVLCLLAIAASCVGAWMQTGASALLLAAGVSGLYGLIHLFDMRRPKPLEAVEPQRIDFEPEARDELPTPSAVVDPPMAADATEDADPAVTESPRSGAGRRKGGSRKSSGRRATARKEAKPVELAPLEEEEEVRAEAFTPPEEVETFDEPELDAHEPSAEPVHIPHAPLFEPEPFVRMQRQAFGRRGRI